MCLLFGDEVAGAVVAGAVEGIANGNGCCLKADDRAGVAGLKRGGGCGVKLGLTTDTSAAWPIPGDTPIRTAIIIRSLRTHSPSLSQCEPVDTERFPLLLLARHLAAFILP